MNTLNSNQQLGQTCRLGRKIEAAQVRDINELERTFFPYLKIPRGRTIIVSQ